MKKLYVLYDAQCPFCLHCRQWLGAQRILLPMDFIPLQSDEAASHFPGIEKWRTADHWLAISDEGEVYQGANAMVMSLYVLEDYREWSVRLSAPVLLPFAAVAVELLSSPRKNISRWMQRFGDPDLVRVLEFQSSVAPLHATQSKHAAPALQNILH